MRFGRVRMKNLSVDELAVLIKKASEAHHQYEQDELGGERDEDWHVWYAKYILNSLEYSH